LRRGLSLQCGMMEALIFHPSQKVITKGHHKMNDNMNQAEVRSIIETTLSSGNKSPGLFDLPKIMGLKSKLEACNSISAVIGILEDNRSLISKCFGLSDSIFDDGLLKLNSMAATA
jgi:hypothetical protein